MWAVVQTAVLALVFRVERGMVGLAGLVNAKIVICFLLNVSEAQAGNRKL